MMPTTIHRFIWLSPPTLNSGGHDRREIVRGATRGVSGYSRVTMPRSPSRARPRLHAIVALAVATATALACGPPAFPPSAQHPLLGAPLPEVRGRSVDGHAIDKGVIAGTPVLVKFFADYCQPCKETLPAAERVHEAYPDVTFIGIDEDDTSEMAKDLAQRFGLTFPVVHDTSNALAGRFRVSAMPMTFVADANGVIRWVGAEGQTEDDIRRAVQAARAVPRPESR
jgi:thiol-disulfide isomerase/thioredoxin